ncbi:predicted protein [Histoplasma capsulatum var. duboisii H88]|uniref:Predicted protein n=1 Tax=Ajellomyces capsulatus (strain H88) TaxID=544711 RepID=F0UI74_AJEC8|nr:predicted protein [Histoplasma capsulatum var. duboisii H88]
MQVWSTGIYKRSFIGPTNALLEAMEGGFLHNKPFHGQLASIALLLANCFGYHTPVPELYKEFSTASCDHFAFSSSKSDPATPGSGAIQGRELPMLGYHVGDEDEAFRLNSQACFPCPIEVVSERHEDTVLRRAAAVSAHNASVGGPYQMGLLLSLLVPLSSTALPPPRR